MSEVQAYSNCEATETLHLTDQCLMQHSISPMHLQKQVLETANTHLKE